MKSTMTSKTESFQNYNLFLQQYFECLKIQQQEGKLPEEFDSAMDNFLLELRELISQPKRETVKDAA